MSYLALLLIVLALAWVGTDIVRRHALRRGMLDVPNARSSHQMPTPRGGGLAVVIAASIGYGALVASGVLDLHLFMALLGGIVVAFVGFLDDRHRLSVKIRLGAHAGAALWAVAWLGGLPPLQIGSHIIEAGWAGYVLAVIGLVWTLNLFNFMDGIDGIAASEAAFIFVAGGLLAGVGDPAVPAAAWVTGAACLGFMAWNWPPARIFMGDVGSGYMGYLAAVLALAEARHSPVALFVWAILGALFFVDATATLIRRVRRGERFDEAHRSHAYQVLARRWQSHRAVTCVFIATNLAVLLPLAWLANTLTRWAALIAATVLLVLGVALSLLARERQPVPRQ